jgi:hypothetical protein
MKDGHLMGVRPFDPLGSRGPREDGSPGRGGLPGALAIATRTGDLRTNQEIEVFLRRLEKRGG